MLTAEARTFGRLARLDESTGLGAQAATTLSKRFHALVSVAVRGELEQRWSRGDVNDTHHHAVSALLTLDPHPRVRLVAGAGHMRGLIVAGASGARFAGALAGALGPVIEAYYNSIPISSNHVFENNWTSYRVKAEVDFWYFELSPALTDRTALALRYERNRAVNRVAVPYDRDILTLSWLHAF